MLSLVPLNALTAPAPGCLADFVCPICSGVAGDEETLAAHMELVHPGWAETLCRGFLATIPRENG